MLVALNTEKVWQTIIKTVPFLWEIPKAPCKKIALKSGRYLYWVNDVIAEKMLITKSQEGNLILQASGR